MVDLSKPSLEGLIYLLRNKDEWPEGFAWEYGDHCTCAIGLAANYWDLLDKGDSWITSRELANYMGLDHKFHEPLFEVLVAYNTKIKTVDVVTPELVADALEEVSNG